MITSEQFAKFKKMPEENSLLDYRRVFSQFEYEKLKTGLIANSMDEKWNGYFFNDAFYMYRSWTGACIYMFDLKKTKEGYVADNTLVNRNSEQYNAKDNEYDVLLLDFLIANLILGESKPFPSRSGNGLPKGLEQHSVAGTGYSEIKVTRKPWWKFW